MNMPPQQAPLSEESVAQATEQAVHRHAGQKGNLLPILHDVQHALGFIPEAAVPLIAQAVQLSRAEVHGVISFYPHFTQAPRAGVVLEVCRAESCQAMGGDQLADHVQQKLGCGFHATSADGKVSLEPVYCLGLCAQSPAVMVNGRPHARVTPAKLDQLLESHGA